MMYWTPRSGKSSGHDTFKRVHFEAHTVGKRAVDIFTGCNEVVAKVMFLLVSVILLTGGSASVHAGTLPPPCQGDPHPCQGDPPEGDPPCQGDPQEGDPLRKEAPPAKETPLPRRPPRRRSPRRRPPKKETPKKEAPPSAKETPLSRPTPMGEIEGDQVQAHTQGGN